MSFSESMKQFSGRVKQYIDQNVITNEESTKTFVILPFLQQLGYDVTNPLVCRPEFIADIPELKQGEKVDYAIFSDGKPCILIEAKPVTADLKKHSGQLTRYFNNTVARLGILTNGLEYQFFTDLDKANLMDTKPFFMFDLFNYKDSHLKELEKFQADHLDFDSISQNATNLRYVNTLKQFLRDELEKPSDEFMRYVMKQVFGKKTVFQKHIDDHREIVKKSLNSFMVEFADERFKKIQDELNKTNAEDNPPEVTNEDDGINTIDEEYGAFYVIRSLLSDTIKPERVQYKDTKSYFGILIDGNTRKWICRLYLESNTKYMMLPTVDKQTERFDIEKVSDIRNYRDKLIEVTKRFV